MGFASSRAVVVGINAYGNGVPALRSAASDARELARLLSADHGYAVTPLLDEAATLAGLKHCFEGELPQQVGADDRLLVYFAGHGIAEQSEEGPTGYLLPQDARADDRASFLPMDVFRGWLEPLPCRHLLVILDCCFAGAFRWAKETRHVRVPAAVIHRERYERFLRRPARQVIASSAYDQEALDTVAGKTLGRRRPEDDAGEHSPFARTLFAGLKGEADVIPKDGGDGVIIAYELATFLRSAVSQSADDVGCEQMPCLWTLGKAEDGEYIFLAPGRLLNLPPAPPLSAENNPYRGLAIYDEAHAELFFGRDQVVKELARAVARQPLTLVLGASGTGKSSLVRAGLLAYPRKCAAATGASADQANDAVLFGLDPVTSGTFQPIVIRPADAPAAPVRALLARLGVGPREQAAGPSATATDETPETATEAVAGWFAADPRRHLLIVIDQLEELVTLCAPKVRDGFVAFLAGLLDREKTRLRIVVTLRSDFEPQFADSTLQRQSQADGARGARFLVPPLRHDELRQIIEKPAAERVLFFEPPELVGRLIDEVNNMPGALPLLSFVLSELYLAYVSRQQEAQRNGQIIDRTITEEDYEKLDGVVGALSRRATEEYEACGEAHRATMRRVMLRMVATEGELARRRVPRDELIYPDPQETERARVVVERLRGARLVVSGRAAGASNGEGDNDDDYVEPAHDALVRAWRKLLDWRREAAAELLVQRKLTEAAADWTRQNRATGLLWTDNPFLPEVCKHLTPADHWLNQRETAFVEATTRRKRRNARVRRAAIVGLVLLTLASAAGAGIAVDRWRQATIDQIAASRDSAKATFLSNQQLEGMQKAIATRKELAGPILSLLPDADSENELNVTMQELLRGARERNRLLVGEKVAGVAFAPDGRMATWNQFSGKVRLWNRDGTSFNPPWLKGTVAADVAFSGDGKLAIAVENKVFFRKLNDDGQWSELSVDKGKVTNIAFSANGNMIAATTMEGNKFGHVQLWNVEDRSPLRPLEGGCTRAPMGVAFSPDGEQVAIACWDGAFLWNRDGTGPRKLDHEGAVNAVAFIPTPEGTMIATGGSDKTVKLWTLEGKLHKTLIGHNDVVWRLDSTRDGRVIVSASSDGTVKLWKIDGTLLATLAGHHDVVRAVAFSDDGKTLASASDDGTVKLWEPGGTPLKALTHDARVYKVAFSPDSRTVLTTSGQGSVTLRDADGWIPNRQQWQYGPITAVAFSRNGKMVATASGDRTVTLGTIEGGTLSDAKLLKGQTGELNLPEVFALSFSPDDRLLAAGGVSRMVQVWNTDDPSREPKLLIETQGRVTGIDYSPGGENIVVASESGEVQIVDSTNGKPIRKLQENGDPITQVRYSPDGKTIVAASVNNTVRLWTADGTSVKTLSGQVVDVARSRDETMIATGSQDGTVQVWKADGTLEKTLGKHNGPVRNVAFSPDGKTVASVSEDEDKTVILWNLQEDLTLGRTLAYACDWMRDYLANGDGAKDVRDLCEKVFQENPDPAPVTAGRTMRE